MDGWHSSSNWRYNRL